jgi:hypothetical protein
MILSVGHGKMVGITTKTSSGVETAFHFKGSPQVMAEALVKRHGKVDALRVAKAVTPDAFWLKVVKALS